MSKKMSSLKVPKTALKNGVSPSQCEAFLTCRRKWLLRANGYTTPGTESRTSFGTVFHWYLSKFYIERKIDNIRKWADIFLEENKLVTGDQQTERDLVVAEAVFSEYVKRYHYDFENSFLGTEIDMKTKATVPQHCIVDSAFTDGKGRIWLMEHKTKGRIDEDGITQQLSMDFQCLFQISVASEFFGKHVTGIIYNIIRTPQLKQGADETLDAYCNRIIADMAKRPEFYFMRFEVVYTPAQVKAFLGDYLFIRTQLIEIAKAKDGAAGCYKNPYACLGRYKCDFLEYCASDSLTGLVKK